MRYGKDRYHKTYDWDEWVSFVKNMILILMRTQNWI